MSKTKLGDVLTEQGIETPPLTKEATAKAAPVVLRGADGQVLRLVTLKSLRGPDTYDTLLPMDETLILAIDTCDDAERRQISVELTRIAQAGLALQTLPATEAYAKADELDDQEADLFSDLIRQKVKGWNQDAPFEVEAFLGDLNPITRTGIFDAIVAISSRGRGGVVAAKN